MSSITGFIRVVKADGGTIYVNADGSISPSTAPIYTADNITYALTGNVSYPTYNGIVVERNNIVIDGNGYAVQGNQIGNGLSLTDTSNVTIENTNIFDFQKGISLDTSSNNTINGNNATANSGDGIDFLSSSDNMVYGNSITRNTNGVWLLSSSNNTISENTITTNYVGAFPMESDPVFGVGLVLVLSSNNTVSKNNIQNNMIGVALGSSSNNTFSENIIASNLDIGIDLELSDTFTPEYSSNNVIYHNSFINNAQQAFGGLRNVWDDGYPSGGNYWSDYNGTDVQNGPYQNETGSDGIGDTPYLIDANNTDRCPVMGIFNIYPVSVPLHVPQFNNMMVTVISNSTITGFLTPISLENLEVTLMFNVTGPNGSTGFCRVSIPTAIMNGTYQVLVNGTEIPYTLLPCSNAGVSYLYFTYSHSTEQVIILPEFPSFLVLALFMIATLLVVIIYKKKGVKTGQS